MNIESQSSSEWPRGLYWFGLTAAIFVFQLIPYTGVFLMFVAAPFWSAITVNFGFIHIAAEAFSGKIHKGWLVLPIIWIIGYAAFAFQSHMTMWRLDASLKEENTKQVIEFNSEKKSLILPSGRTAYHIVSGYDLEVAFDRTANYGKSYVAHKIGSKDFCDKISDHPGHMNAKLENLRGSERTRFSGGMCVYTTIEDPKGETVSVEIEGRDVPNAAIPHLLQVITLKDGIRDRKLAAGTARPLSWLPLPIIGCTLVSSRAEWTCFFEFWRNTANLGAIDASGDLTAKVVARALGFKPRR